MTTDITFVARTVMRRMPIAGLLAVLAIWFTGMGLAALALRPDAIVAFGPPPPLAAAIAGSDGALLGAGHFSITARTGPSTVRSLYAAGAWLVWPAIGKGCGRG